MRTFISPNNDSGVKRVSVLVLAFVLSACAASDEAAYPTLAPRPIEKIVAAEQVPAVASVKPVDPSFAAKLQKLRVSVGDAQTALAQALASAAKPAPDAERGSEAWVDNQTALSRLGTAQGALRNADTDLGALMADLARERVGGADTGALETEGAALQKQIDALLTQSQQEIDQRR